MINANELRIGNWVKCGGFKRLYGEFRVAEIYPDQITIEQKPNDGYTVEEVDPITLTPEILEKCGFEKEGDTYKILNDNIDYCFRISFTGSGYFSSNVAANQPMKYLHTLQNLYYCLTGEELTINL